MADRITGGYTVYGARIGILMLDSRFPRIPGDIGNATTFSFPVAYKIAKGALNTRMDEMLLEFSRGDRNITEQADNDVVRLFIRLFVESAKELIRDERVRAITTSCGFLAAFQKEIADAVNVPVFTSSLMQIPLAYSLLKRDQKVGVITARKKNLTKQVLAAIGVEHVPMKIVGMDDTEEFARVFSGRKYPSNETPTIDPKKIENEMTEVANGLIEKFPSVGAIVLECTNMPPYAHAVQKATGLAVFDIVTLTNLVHAALVRKKIEGWL